MYNCTKSICIIFIFNYFYLLTVLSTLIVHVININDHQGSGLKMLKIIEISVLKSAKNVVTSTQNKL